MNVSPTDAAAGGDSDNAARGKGDGVRFYRGLFLGLPLGLLLWFCIGYAFSQDLSHCGPDAFSPPAPPEICNQVHYVPEPSSLWLLLVGLVALKRKG